MDRIMEALGSKANYDVMTLINESMNQKKEQVRILRMLMSRR